jgi:predicted DCC family thiol-disulfide oxidoreductase YuxK
MVTATHDGTADTPTLTVFYDGSCPLCTREIGFYRRRQGADAVAWVDVSTAAQADVAPGLSCSAAMARFHVQRPDGALVSGGRAFAELWAVLPAFAWAGRLFRSGPLGALLDLAYRAFLPLRPRLQRLARKKG